MRYFFFGSLMDADMRAVVLGRQQPAQAAWLPGYRRCRVRGESYPMLVPDAAAEADGIAVDGISPAQADRIAWFEDDDYALRPCRIRLADSRLAAAAVWLATHQLRPDPRPWRLAAWQRSEKVELLALTERWMALQGRLAPDQTGAAWEALKAELAGQRRRRAAG